MAFYVLGKTCAFLGNNYDKVLDVKVGHRTPQGLKEQICKEIINLIENEKVDTFLVGERGGYEIDAYDVVLAVRREYRHIKVYLVISAVTDLNEMGGIYYKQGNKRRDFDDFILPPKCESGYKKLCIVYRNRFIIENTDFIIAYNKYEGRAKEFCKAAEIKGVKVVELATRNETF